MVKSKTISKEVIEIIKNKNVDIGLLISLANLREYNRCVRTKLTQEEYNKVKEEMTS